MRVSILVNTWSPSAKSYLDLCMRSIFALNYPKDQLDVVLVGRKSYAPEYPGVKTVAPDSDQFGNEFGQNFGVAHTDSTSEFLFLINDDVFLTKNCLKNLVDIASGDTDMLLMPISPCDNYWKYSLHFPFQHQGQTMLLTERFYKYDQLAPYAEALMNTDSLYPQGAIFTDMLCTYALLLSRRTFERIGPLDEGFDTGQSDYDYCRRAEALNIPRVIALNALVYHFGGATSETGHTLERRVRNARYWKSKYGEWPEGFDASVIKDGE